MKCLILAAGYATRLYPLTENFPKPLLEVGGKTILDWLIEDIDTTGEVDEYVVISNGKFAHHFEDVGNLALLAQVTHAQRLQRRHVRHLRQFSLECGLQGSDLLVHVYCLLF